MSDVAFPEKYYVENFPEYSNYGKILEIFRKNTMEIFGNFPEKNMKFSGPFFRLTSLLVCVADIVGQG